MYLMTFIGQGLRMLEAWSMSPRLFKLLLMLHYRAEQHTQRRALLHFYIYVCMYILMYRCPQLASGTLIDSYHSHSKSTANFGPLDSLAWTSFAVSRLFSSPFEKPRLCLNVVTTERENTPFWWFYHSRFDTVVCVHRQKSAHHTIFLRKWWLVMRLLTSNHFTATVTKDG